MEHALAHLAAQRARHQIGRVVEEQIIQIGAVVAPGPANFQQSRKPLVVTSAVFAPLPSITMLVAMVVP